MPYVVGAKKGFPNFNEFAVGSQVQVTRKLELRKRIASDVRPYQTNQMFIIGISNAFALEGWNPYKLGPTNTRVLEAFCDNVMSTVLTNDAGAFFTNVVTVNNQPNPMTSRFFDPAANNRWAGEQFRIPLTVGQVGLPDSVYTNFFPFFWPISHTNAFEPNNAAYTNHWGLTIKNRIRYFLFDDGELVDVVSMNDLTTTFDISAQLSRIVNLPGLSASPIDGVWDITPQSGTTVGVMAQLDISQGNRGVARADWGSYGQDQLPAGNDRDKSIDAFLVFLGQTARFNTGVGPSTNVTMQAPFTPTRRMYQATTWEVNDPFVHYTTEDLQTVDAFGTPTNIVTTGLLRLVQSLSLTNNGSSIGRRNERYKPWGGNPDKADPSNPSNDPTAYDFSVKDSGIWSPDDWRFPTNKFPNVGWLGRVHRGTPWQTIYLKAAEAPRQNWLMPLGPATSMAAHPTNDWRIADLFTAALHPNTTRGQLSVNQTNLAAWSAVLSGVAATKITLPNNPNDEPQRTNHFVQPAALDPALMQIFEGISRVRENMPLKRFEHMGDILAVPELTTASPFLKPPFTDSRVELTYYVRDVDFERIPDQILSLLKLGEPRYVIYAFGQSLKPEYVDPATGVALNYQITGEVATRTVVHVEFDQVTDPSDPRYGKPEVKRPHVVVEQFNILPPE